MQSRSYVFKNLLCSASGLEDALTVDPTLITEQDEHGLTLLHHLASLGASLNLVDVSQTMTVLLDTPGLDFTIKDALGNTPLHIAASCCKDRLTCEYIFPELIKEANKRGFDFATLGNQGQSVLHLASRTSYTYPRGLGRVNNVNNLLQHADNPGLDTLSSSGSTALFYAINHVYYAEAHALLDAGANPSLCGNKTRDPFNEIDNCIFDLTKLLSRGSLKEYQKENLNYHLAMYKTLQRKMFSLAKSNPLTPLQTSTLSGFVGFDNIPPQPPHFKKYTNELPGVRIGDLIGACEATFFDKPTNVPKEVPAQKSSIGPRRGRSYTQ